MVSILSKVFGAGSGRELRSYQSRLKEVETFADAFSNASDEELKAASARLRRRAAAGESLDDLLPEAFALVREASERVLGMRHYDVQLIGAMALHDGNVAEMATGEGKTLAATAAAYLNALTGETVHVVTVNDYLARRDAEWMGPLYEFLGLTVGLIQSVSELEERQAAYACDVTYATNAQLGFDYLRDNMAKDPSERVQRGHGFAIVDEADSILIDEARVPLVISGAGEFAAQMYRTFAEIIPQLDPEEHVEIDEAKKIVYATEAGLDRVEELLGQEIYADASGRLANHLRQALRAEFLYKRDVDYAVLEGGVHIVDEFTGRILPGRRYAEGLHQALEAKENVRLNRESLTMANVTLQNYFRMYKKLSGMTGTAMTDDKEFKGTYGMRVVAVPTNKPVIRDDKGDLVFRTAEAKFSAVADEVARRHKLGQPVLVGTASIKDSELLSEILEEMGVPHSVLNAKNHAEEAAVIAQAGRQGAVTISTNMAGRGTDIHLGGNWDALYDEALRGVRVRGKEPEQWMLDHARGEADYVTEREGYVARLHGGLCVIGTQRHESRRIDDQLRGRAGRQGDVGESVFYLSLEDELLEKFGGERLKGVADMMEKQGLGDVDSPVRDAAVSKVLDAAQREVESLHAAQRKYVLEFDDVLDRQRAALYRERASIVDGEKDVLGLAPEVIRDVVGDVVAACCPYSDPSDDWDLDALRAWASQMTGHDASFVREVEHGEDPDVLVEAVADEFEAILEAKCETMGEEALSSVARGIMLQVLDQKWVLHLQDMDHLRQGIMLRAVGRMDPLLSYKEESYDAFGELVASAYEDWLNLLLRFDSEAAKPAESEASAVVIAAQGEAAAPAVDFSPITDNPLG